MEIQIRDTVTVRATIDDQPWHAGEGVVFKLRYLEYENEELNCSTGPLTLHNCRVDEPKPVAINNESLIGEIDRWLFVDQNGRVDKEDLLRMIREHNIHQSVENLVDSMPPDGLALYHLGEVLCMLSDLHPDEQCRAYVGALAYHNAKCPTEQVMPNEGYSSKIVTVGPLDRILERESVKESHEAYRRFLDLAFKHLCNDPDTTIEAITRAFQFALDKNKQENGSEK